MKFDFLEMSRQLERVQTPRLALRPLTLSDAWPLFRATRNPLFNRNLLWCAPDSVDAVVARVDAIVRASRKGDMSAFSAVSLETGEFVGLLRYMHHESRTDALEIGLWVSDRWWHGRIAHELGSLAIDSAFDLTDVPMLFGHALEGNRSSRALMLSVGMREQAPTTRQREDGTTMAARDFTIDRDEWMGCRKRDFSYYGIDGRMVEFAAQGEDQKLIDERIAKTSPRDPTARTLALEALRVASATAASSVAAGSILPQRVEAESIPLPLISQRDLNLSGRTAAHEDTSR